MRDTFQPYDLEGMDLELDTALSIMLRSLRKHEAMRIIKTWCNAWATSARMHEDTCLPCLFGCQDASDRMDHYIHCPFWFYLLLKLLSDSPPSPLPLTRLALVDPSIPTLLAVSCSFVGYHALKRLARLS